MKKLCIAIVLLIVIVPIFASKLIRVDVTDDFGDPTGEYYVTFDEDLVGTYKNNSKSGSIKWNAIFKDKRLLFVIKEDGIDKDVSTSSIYGEYYCDTKCSYELTLKNSSGETKSGYLRLFKSDNYKYNILRWNSSWTINSFSELVSYLIDNNSLKLVIKSKYGTYQLGECHFTGLDDVLFGKSQYNEALDLMNKGEFEKAVNLLADYQRDNPEGYDFFDTTVIQTKCSEQCGRYFVGAIGPTGGYIFYDCDEDNDNGNPDGLVSSECGWRYLEAASSDLSSKYIFGYYRPDGETNIEIGTGIVVGTGKSNTVNLMNKMGDKAFNSELDDKYTRETMYAAKACDSYSIEVDGVTYDDWFLPSKDELNLMYVNLYEMERGNFNEPDLEYYWTSSEVDNCRAWGHFFSSFGGKQNGYVRKSECYVRPIRAF